MITRFAPSPTGYLHLGHAFAARFAHQLAREHHGAFLLRFEDIDLTRVRDPYYSAIEQDLQWLGLDWDQPAVRQRDRLPLYHQALEQLRSLNVVYPCFCTRKEIQSELANIGHAPHGPEGPLYPGSCKQLPHSERQQRIAEKHPHAWRLDAGLAASILGDLSFQDHIHGTIPVDFQLLGDVILSRKDIATSYHLAVVVDDAAQGVTDVTRGEDLLASTHIHRILQALLGLPEPRYHHHRLMRDSSGKRLAKRDDSLSLRTLRQLGHNQQQVLNLLDSPAL